MLNSPLRALKFNADHDSRRWADSVATQPLPDLLVSIDLTEKL